MSRYSRQSSANNRILEVIDVAQIKEEWPEDSPLSNTGVYRHFTVHRPLDLSCTILLEMLLTIAIWVLECHDVFN